MNNYIVLVLLAIAFALLFVFAYIAEFLVQKQIDRDREKRKNVKPFHVPRDRLDR
jgi:hypothetical protein